MIEGPSIGPYVKELASTIYEPPKLALDSSPPNTSGITLLPPLLLLGRHSARSVYTNRAATIRTMFSRLWNGLNPSTSLTNAHRDKRDVDASRRAPATRPRTLSRLGGLKGLATCHRQSLHVTVTSTTVLTATDATTKDITVATVFAPTHTTSGDDLAVHDGPKTFELGPEQDLPARHADASEHVSEAHGHLSAGSCEPPVNAPVQEWRDENDAHQKSLQIWSRRQNHAQNPLMERFDPQSSKFLVHFYSFWRNIVWDSQSPRTLHVVLNPADEDLSDYCLRWYKALNVQLYGGYLTVPFHTTHLAFSPFSPQPSHLSLRKLVAPVPGPAVFSVSGNTAFMNKSSDEPASVCSVVMQRHAINPLASTSYSPWSASPTPRVVQAQLASLTGSTFCTQYVDAAAFTRLQSLWTDPAETLALCRRCSMTLVLESPTPFCVPRIVVSGILPPAPGLLDASGVVAQDESSLALSTSEDPAGMEYETKAEANWVPEGDEEAQETRWRQDSEEEEEESTRCSESEEESQEEEPQEAHTPSPSPPSIDLNKTFCPSIRSYWLDPWTVVTEYYCPVALEDAVFSSKPLLRAPHADLECTAWLEEVVEEDEETTEPGYEDDDASDNDTFPPTPPSVLKPPAPRSQFCRSALEPVPEEDEDEDEPGPRPSLQLFSDEEEEEPVLKEAAPVPPAPITRFQWSEEDELEPVDDEWYVKCATNPVR
ncbi:hypothetical protein B0H10DRAFT_105595 [Mycena sp. CBHHK59/15]|nr:hypothetical protein B0H10DRAFT_105595 [Mycena sp. CBHHK59/15]